MSNLYLIATEHVDLVRGPEKLVRVYDRIKPDILLSEMNEIDYRRAREVVKRFSGGLKKFITDERLLGQFIDYLKKSSVGFEYPTNEAYAREHGISNYQIDLPGSQGRLIRLNEIPLKLCLYYVRKRGHLDHGRILEILQKKPGPSKREVKNLWNRERRIENSVLGEIRSLFVRILTGRIGRPDKYMEERIRELYDPSKVIASTVGMLHCVDSLTRSTLYSRIKDLHPERIPLIE